MSEALASGLVMALGGYVLLGVVTALLYLFGGAGRIDPAAKGKGMPLRVRALIFPGIVGLWPLMLAKFFTQTEPPVS